MHASFRSFMKKTTLLSLFFAVSFFIFLCPTKLIAEESNVRRPYLGLGVSFFNTATVKFPNNNSIEYDRSLLYNLLVGYNLTHNIKLYLNYLQPSEFSGEFDQNINDISVQYNRLFVERFDIGVNYFFKPGFSSWFIGLGVNSINAVLKVDIGAPLLEVEGEAVDKEIQMSGVSPFLKLGYNAGIIEFTFIRFSSLDSDGVASGSGNFAVGDKLHKGEYNTSTSNRFNFSFNLDI